MTSLRDRLRAALKSDGGSLFSDTAIVFAIRVVAALATYATQVVLARWMGASQLGVVVYAMSWLWILSLGAGLGLGSAANRFIPQYNAADNPAAVRGFIVFSRRAVIVTGVVIALAGMALLGARSGAFSDSVNRPYALALGAVPLIALAALHNNIARAFLWFPFASFTGVLLRPALLLIAVLVASALAVSPSPALVMGLLLGAAVVVLATQLIGLRRRFPASLDQVDTVQHGRSWVRVAVPIVMAELFVGYYVDLNIIVSGFFLAPAEIAVYNAALRTVAIIAFGIAAVALATAPRAARLYAQGDQVGLQRLVTRSTHLMFWPSVAAFVGLVVTGRWILGLFGPEFVAGYPALLITGAAQTVIAATGPLLPLLNVTGHQDRGLLVCGFSLLLTPLLYVVLMPPFGLVGGAVAFLCAGLIFSAWLCFMVIRHVGVNPLVFRTARRSK